MLFSSAIFLFLFLPITLLLYYLLKESYRNFLLLVVSLLFYAWGEPVYILLMLISVVVNYGFGILIERYNSDIRGKYFLALGVILNILTLLYYKYFGFFIEITNTITGLEIQHVPAALPLGISFYTFHSLSYLIDIRRGIVRAQKNILDLGLYISFFPQLVAGPIIRYKDINKEIHERETTFDKFTSGVTRFIVGLSKKILLANVFGEMADKVFQYPSTEISPLIAWLGIVSYALQIFFDFSGYSDMAIGLGRMFGFDIKENFDYPYIATSIKDFWRRWHISLSTWFRDYLYVPLGGNRVTPWKIYRNLLIVFFVTGFWHGASWNFVIWGLFHGTFIVLERFKFGTFIERAWKPFQYFYTWTVVLIGWVFFRVEKLPDAISYLSSMFGISNKLITDLSFTDIVNNKSLLCFLVGFVLCTPVMEKLPSLMNRRSIGASYLRIGVTLLLTLLFILSIANIAGQTYNPFIYFRF